jgi:AraC-like DNA-binding protein
MEPSALQGSRKFGFSPAGRFSDFVADLPVREAGATQIGSGKAVFLSRRACGRDLVIARLAVEPRMASYALPKRGWLALHIPLSWRGEYLFNSAPARRGQMFLINDIDGRVGCAEAQDFVTVGIRRRRLEKACARLAGVEVDSILLEMTTISLGKTVGGGLLCDLLQHMPSGPQDGEGGNLSYIDADKEAGLFDKIALALGDVTRTHLRRRNASDPVRLVRAAEALLEANPERAFGLSDLCAAAGVSFTRLNLAFNEVYGVSPARYIKLRRLTQVRDRLLDIVNPPRSIKDAMLSRGFWSSGQFARYYTKLFGELPSETFGSLRQTRCLALLPQTRPAQAWPVRLANSEKGARQKFKSRRCDVLARR